VLNLILTACLIASPSDCREVQIAANEADTPFGCAVMGMQQVADWATLHPAFRGSGYRCTRPERRA